MTISVLVPTYRRPDRLRRCLEALAAGERLPDQTVVTVREDDTPSQDALSQCQRALRGLKLELATVDRPGQPAAINEGLKLASGAVLCFIDDDVEVHRDWLRRIEERFGDPSVGGVGGRDIIFEGGQRWPDEPTESVGRLTWYGRRTGNHHKVIAGDEPREVQHLKGCNMAFRRGFVEGFDEHFIGAPSLNDTDVSLTVAKKGARLVYDPLIRVDHHLAERPFSGGRSYVHPAPILDHSHNATYCMLKHLHPWARPVFIAYMLLLGQATGLGILRLLVNTLRGHLRGPARQFGAHYGGVWAGLRTYLRARRRPPSA